MTTQLMTHRFATPALAGHLWADRSIDILRFALLALVGSALLTLSAKIQVPFYPVPMTMQTFAVVSLAAAYGLRLGTATMLLYFMEGALGLPVFANGGGLVYMAGPTGGYLVGYLLATLLIGYFADKGWGKSVLKLAFIGFVATKIILVCGVVWLAQLTEYTAGAALATPALATDGLLNTLLASPLLWQLQLVQGTGYEKAIYLGGIRFFWGDLLKLALSALLVPTLWKLVDKSRLSA